MTLILFNKPYGVLCQFTVGRTASPRPTLSDFIDSPGVKVANAAQTLASFGPRDTGLDAARLEDILTAIGSSTEALQDELSVFGTSQDEQEVSSFGSGTPSSSSADFSLAYVNGLVPGSSYTLTFSFSPLAQQLTPGALREFPIDVPVRDTGDQAIQRIVRADFSLNSRAGGAQFILIGRPDDIPDNFYLAQINLSPAAVPEPAAWAFMILGLGMIGAQVRRRRTSNLQSVQSASGALRRSGARVNSSYLHRAP